jgi:hypothetical protein
MMVMDNEEEIKGLATDIAQQMELLSQSLAKFFTA